MKQKRDTTVTENSIVSTGEVLVEDVEENDISNPNEITENTPEARVKVLQLNFVCSVCSVCVRMRMCVCVIIIVIIIII
jgi:hypothetical protein